MDRRVVLGSIAAVSLGGIAAYFLLRGGDEAQIREALARLAKVIRIAKDDSPLGRAARIKGAFDDLFVERVSVDIPELPDARPGRAELVRLASAAFGIWSSLEADFASVRVAFEPGANASAAAAVDATVTLRGARSGGGEKGDTRKVAFRFVKDSGWRIASVTVYPPPDPG
jgi:hypothetical protein